MKTPSSSGRADPAFSVAVRDKKVRTWHSLMSMGNNLTMILLCLLKHLQRFDAVGAIKNILWKQGNICEILPCMGDRMGRQAGKKRVFRPCCPNLRGFSGSTHYPWISFPPQRGADMVQLLDKGLNSLNTSQHTIEPLNSSVLSLTQIPTN